MINPDDIDVTDDDDEPAAVQTHGIPAFVTMEPGEQRDKALRVWSVDCFRDKDGVILVDHWRAAADLAHFINTGEMTTKTSLKAVK